MKTFIDIETIPDPKFKQAFLDDAYENFKAPSTLTKQQAADDLGITDDKKIKYTPADEMKKLWEEEFKNSKAEEVGIENWKKCSFDAGKGMICGIAFATECHADHVTNAVIGPGEKGDRELVEWFFDILPKEISVARRTVTTPFFIGHYVAEFDLKFLFRRAVILGVKPPFQIPFIGRHNQDYYDTMVAWCGYKDRISLDNLCKTLGIEGKIDGMDGSKVLDLWEAGKLKEIGDYNANDVDLVRQVYKKLTFGGCE